MRKYALLLVLLIVLAVDVFLPNLFPVPGPGRPSYIMDGSSAEIMSSTGLLRGATTDGSYYTCSFFRASYDTIITAKHCVSGASSHHYERVYMDEKKLVSMDVESISYAKDSDVALLVVKDVGVIQDMKLWTVCPGETTPGDFVDFAGWTSASLGVPQLIRSGRIAHVSGNQMWVDILMYMGDSGAPLWDEKNRCTPGVSSQIVSRESASGKFQISVYARVPKMGSSSWVDK